jgi:hypothetical protein
MVRRLLPLFPLLLAGCALSPPLFSPATPIEVKVPVYQPIYCTPPAVANPTLPISGLTAVSSPADTIRAYAASVVMLKATVRELDALIEGCEEPANATNDVTTTNAPATGTTTGAPADGTMADSVRVSLSNARNNK